MPSPRHTSTLAATTAIVVAIAALLALSCCSGGIAAETLPLSCQQTNSISYTGKPGDQIRNITIDLQPLDKPCDVVIRNVQVEWLSVLDSPETSDAAVGLSLTIDNLECVPGAHVPFSNTRFVCVKVLQALSETRLISITNVRMTYPFASLPRSEYSVGLVLVAHAYSFQQQQPPGRFVMQRASLVFSHSNITIPGGVAVTTGAGVVLTLLNIGHMANLSSLVLSHLELRGTFQSRLEAELIAPSVARTGDLDNILSISLSDFTADLTIFGASGNDIRYKTFYFGKMTNVSDVRVDSLDTSVTLSSACDLSVATGGVSESCALQVFDLYFLLASELPRRSFRVLNSRFSADMHSDDAVEAMVVMIATDAIANASAVEVSNTTIGIVAHSAQRRVISHVLLFGNDAPVTNVGARVDGVRGSIKAVACQHAESESMTARATAISKLSVLYTSGTTTLTSWAARSEVRDVALDVDVSGGRCRLQVACAIYFRSVVALHSAVLLRDVVMSARVRSAMRETLSPPPHVALLQFFASDSASVDVEATAILVTNACLRVDADSISMGGNNSIRVYLVVVRHVRFSVLELRNTSLHANVRAVAAAHEFAAVASLVVRGNATFASLNLEDALMLDRVVGGDGGGGVGGTDNGARFVIDGHVFNASLREHRGAQTSATMLHFTLPVLLPRVQITNVDFRAAVSYRAVLLHAGRIALGLRSLTVENVSFVASVTPAAPEHVKSCSCWVVYFAQPLRDVGNVTFRGAVVNCTVGNRAHAQSAAAHGSLHVLLFADEVSGVRTSSQPIVVAFVFDNVSLSGRAIASGGASAMLSVVFLRKGFGDIGAFIFDNVYVTDAVTHSIINNQIAVVLFSKPIVTQTVRFTGCGIARARTTGSMATIAVFFVNAYRNSVSSILSSFVSRNCSITDSEGNLNEVSRGALAGAVVIAIFSFAANQHECGRFSIVDARVVRCRALMTARASAQFTLLIGAANMKSKIASVVCILHFADETVPPPSVLTVVGNFSVIDGVLFAANVTSTPLIEVSGCVIDGVFADVLEPLEVSLLYFGSAVRDIGRVSVRNSHLGVTRATSREQWVVLGALVFQALLSVREEVAVENCSVRLDTADANANVSLVAVRSLPWPTLSGEARQRAGEDGGIIRAGLRVTDSSLFVSEAASTSVVSLLEVSAPVIATPASDEGGFTVSHCSISVGGSSSSSSSSSSSPSSSASLLHVGGKLRESAAFAIQHNNISVSQSFAIVAADSAAFFDAGHIHFDVAPHRLPAGGDVLRLASSASSASATAASPTSFWVLTCSPIWRAAALRRFRKVVAPAARARAVGPPCALSKTATPSRRPSASDSRELSASVTVVVPPPPYVSALRQRAASIVTVAVFAGSLAAVGGDGVSEADAVATRHVMSTVGDIASGRCGRVRRGIARDERPGPSEAPLQLYLGAGGGYPAGVVVGNVLVVGCGVFVVVFAFWCKAQFQQQQQKQKQRARRDSSASNLRSSSNSRHNKSPSLKELLVQSHVLLPARFGTTMLLDTTIGSGFSLALFAWAGAGWRVFGPLLAVAVLAFVGVVLYELLVARRNVETFSRRRQREEEDNAAAAAAAAAAVASNPQPQAQESFVATLDRGFTYWLLPQGEWKCPLASAPSSSSSSRHSSSHGKRRGNATTVTHDDELNFALALLLFKMHLPIAWRFFAADIAVLVNLAVATFVGAAVDDPYAACVAEGVLSILIIFVHLILLAIFRPKQKRLPQIFKGILSVLSIAALIVAMAGASEDAIGALMLALSVTLLLLAVMIIVSVVVPAVRNFFAERRAKQQRVIDEQERAQRQREAERRRMRQQMRRRHSSPSSSSPTSVRRRALADDDPMHLLTEPMTQMGRDDFDDDAAAAERARQQRDAEFAAHVRRHMSRALVDAMRERRARGAPMATATATAAAPQEVSLRPSRGFGQLATRDCVFARFAELQQQRQRIEAEEAELAKAEAQLRRQERLERIERQLQEEQQQQHRSPRRRHHHHHHHRSDVDEHGDPLLSSARNSPQRQRTPRQHHQQQRRYYGADDDDDGDPLLSRRHSPQHPQQWTARQHQDNRHQPRPQPEPRAQRRYHGDDDEDGDPLLSPAQHHYSQHQHQHQHQHRRQL